MASSSATARAEQVFLGGCDPSSTSNAQAWHWTYDAAGNMAGQTPPVNTTLTPLDLRFWDYDAGGRLTSVTDGPSLTVTDRHSDTTYDAVGRPVTVTTYLGAGTGTIKLQTTTSYLGDGQLAALAYAEDGSTVDTVTQTYDPAGRPDQLKRGGTVLTDFAW